MSVNKDVNKELDSFRERVAIAKALIDNLHKLGYTGAEADNLWHDRPLNAGILPPVTDSRAVAALEAMNKEYNYPANPANCARYGWEAARRFITSKSAMKVLLDSAPMSWECNECGAQEYTLNVPEEDVHNLSCGHCGGDEWHKAVMK